MAAAQGGNPANEASRFASLLPNNHGFYGLLDHLPFGAYTCDSEGLITYFNEPAEKLWGRKPKINDPRDRFCGSFKLFLVDGTPIDHSQCWMARALQSGKRFDGKEILIDRPDGYRLTALAHASPFFDASGKVIGAFNVLVDISDRKAAEVAQARLAAIVESSDDAIISKTLDGIIITWNAGAQRLFGWTAAEAVGQPITILIPPERLDEETEIISRLRRGDRVDHFETVRITKDGRRRNISLTVSPVLDATGRVIAASKVARDITARKQADAALVALKDQLALQLADMRRLHEMSVRLSNTLELEAILQETLRTAAAVESTSMALLSLCDVDGKHFRIGASFGFTDEFLRKFSEVPLGCSSCGTSLQERRRVVIEDIDNDPRFEHLKELAHEEGFRAVHCTPLITRGGKLVGVLSTHFRRPHRPSDREIHLIDLCVRQAVDFIENAQLYAELREADRRKDEFLATLAHELRNPLAPITNSLELLKMTDDLSPTVNRIRGVMDRQVSQMVRLVDDLLEVSRITRGKIDLRQAPVELAAVVGSAIETSRPLLDAAGHQLAIKLPPEPITLYVDAVRLAQVLANILNNAIKYTERGGQIWLTARRDAKHAVISIRDSGVGIRSDMLPRVFEVFAQSDQTASRSQGGLGIGLALAKKLVELHGGNITAQSAGVGKGSEFTVSLPMVEGTCTMDQIAPSAIKSKLPTFRILVVDDTQAAAYMLGKLLEMIGQKVQIANSGAVGLEMVRLNPPQLIISDIGMPEMDGYELARRVRKIRASTTRSWSRSLATAKKPIDYVLWKPVSIVIL